METPGSIRSANRWFSQAVFTVGQKVPVLGATTITGAGISQQSVSYMDSGVTFTVKPDVHEETIDLDMMQTISIFIATTNGVNNSPTLQQRSLSSSLTMKDTELIAVGGLEQNVDQFQENKSFLVFHNETKSVVKTSIMILLQLDRI